MKKIYLILFLLVFFSGLAFSEDLTITTYYPSPHGSYNELSANRLSINTDSVASNNGVIRFNPVDIASDGNEGELYYDSSEHRFKYRDNTTGWKNIIGGGPDYDSGWVYDYRTPSHSTTFTFPAAFTNFPSQIMIWFATSIDPTVVYPVRTEPGTMSIDNQNPYGIEVQKDRIVIRIWNGAPLYSVWVLTPTAHWVHFNEGYWRVLAWK